MDLDSFVNRRGVYIEGGKYAVVRVLRVAIEDGGFAAGLARDADPAVRLVYFSRETPPRFAVDETVFAEPWKIYNRNWRFYERYWLDPAEAHWTGAPNMGWHLFLAEDVVRRFLERDLGWKDDYLPVGVRPLRTERGSCEGPSR